jgi:hypothetical protein
MLLSERFGFVMAPFEREWLRQMSENEGLSEASTLRRLIRRAAREELKVAPPSRRAADKSRPREPVLSLEGTTQ